MKLTYLSLLFALAYTTLFGTVSSIEGEWISINKSIGGLGITREYRGDGVTRIAFGAMLNLKYTTKGKSLIISDAEGNVIQKHKFTISDNTLTLKGKLKQVLSRIDGEANTGIIGKWIGKHDTGDKQIMHFTKNMNYYYSVPMATRDGKYSIKGDTLFEEWPGKNRNAEYSWKIKDNILTLIVSDGSKTEQYEMKR